MSEVIDKLRPINTDALLLAAHFPDTTVSDLRGTLMFVKGGLLAAGFAKNHSIIEAIDQALSASEARAPKRAPISIDD